MPELRKDPVTGRWVIISTERRKRPSDFRLERVAPSTGEHCPFCAGHEDMTPPEVLRVPAERRRAERAGLGRCASCRTSFRRCRSKATLDREGEGLFDRMNGIGAHEVIIETPDHDKTLATMSEPEIERVLWAFRERVLDLKQDRRFRYILDLQEPRRAGGRDARALALAADRAADRAATSCARRSTARGGTSQTRSAACSATSSGRRWPPGGA